MRQSGLRRHPPSRALRVLVTAPGLCVTYSGLMMQSDKRKEDAATQMGAGPSSIAHARVTRGETGSLVQSSSSSSSPKKTVGFARSVSAVIDLRTKSRTRVSDHEAEDEGEDKMGSRGKGQRLYDQAGSKGCRSRVRKTVGESKDANANQDGFSDDKRRILTSKMLPEMLERDSKRRPKGLCGLCNSNSDFIANVYARRQ